jgi:hypothetical protein
LLLAYVLYCTPLEITGVLAYADVDLSYDHGTVSVVKIRPGRYAKPTSLRRYRGRFTAIVAHGKGPLAELQFDFPLLAQAETDDVSPEARALAERMRRGVTSSTTVRVPLPEGADTLVVLDAASMKEVRAPLVARAAPPPGR